MVVGFSTFLKSGSSCLSLSFLIVGGVTMSEIFTSRAFAIFCAVFMDIDGEARLLLRLCGEILIFSASCRLVIPFARRMKSTFLFIVIVMFFFCKDTLFRLQRTFSVKIFFNNEQ